METCQRDWKDVFPYYPLPPSLSVEWKDINFAEITKDYVRQVVKSYGGKEVDHSALILVSCLDKIS